MITVSFRVVLGDFSYSGTESGKTYDDVVGAAKVHAIPTIVSKLPWIARSIARSQLKRMTPLEFARQVISRWNAAMNHNIPQPATCEEFVRWAVACKFATIVQGDK